MAAASQSKNLKLDVDDFPQHDHHALQRVKERVYLREMERIKLLVSLFAEDRVQTDHSLNRLKSDCEDMICSKMFGSFFLDDARDSLEFACISEGDKPRLDQIRRLQDGLLVDVLMKHF